MKKLVSHWGGRKWQALLGLATLWTAGGVLALSLMGCREPYTEQGWATKPIAQDYTFPVRDESGGVVAEGTSVARGQLEAGRKTYMHYCYACHGVNGDGKGPAAHGLRPPPRDFRTANFKFGAVRSGELPNDDDLIRIVQGGLHGTAMLEWDITEGELWRVVQFIKTFPQPPCDEGVAPEEVTAKCKEELAAFPGGKPSRWLDVYERGKKEGQPKPTGEPIAVAEDPWVGKASEALERGAALYHLQAQCANCHPAYMTKQDLYDASKKLEPDSPVTSFRDGMYLGIVLEASKNPYEVNLMPPDFLLQPLRSIRKGQQLPDLYRLIAAGVGGVMPAWIDGLKPEDIWALAHYVKSLTDLGELANRQAMAELRDKLANQPPFVPPGEDKEPKSVKITVSEPGEITVDGEVVSEADLGEHFKKLAEEAEIQAVIVADEGAAVAKVVAVLDALKAAGVTKVSLPKQGEEQDEETVDDTPEGGAPDAPAPEAPEPKAPKAPGAPAPTEPTPPAPAPKAPAPKAPAPKAPPDTPYD
jgi:biopolymer transport protein ExbD